MGSRQKELREQTVKASGGRNAADRRGWGAGGERRGPRSCSLGGTVPATFSPRPGLHAGRPPSRERRYATGPKRLYANRVGGAIWLGLGAERRQEQVLRAVNPERSLFPSFVESSGGG